jgi:hypothetical protein
MARNITVRVIFFATNNFQVFLTSIGLQEPAVRRIWRRLDLTIPALFRRELKLQDLLYDELVKIFYLVEAELFSKVLFIIYPVPLTNYIPY